jgi:hypothetical protein
MNILKKLRGNPIECECGSIAHYKIQATNSNKIPANLKPISIESLFGFDRIKQDTGHSQWTYDMRKYQTVTCYNCMNKIINNDRRIFNIKIVEFSDQGYYKFK